MREAHVTKIGSLEEDKAGEWRNTAGSGRERKQRKQLELTRTEH